MTGIPPELRAQYTDAARRVAEEGEREAPVTAGSDTALRLQRLYRDLPDFLAEQRDRAGEAA